MSEGKRLDIFDVIHRWNHAAVVAISVALIVVIGLIDYLTGVELSLSFFYLIPICLVAASSGMAAVILSGTLCVCVGLAGSIANGVRHSSPLIFVWNGTMRFGIFLVVGYLINRLVRILEEEKQLSRTDALTGVANRRLFYELLQAEMSRSRRSGRPFTLVYVDVDDFKRINDSIGHAKGDEALRYVASTMKAQVRDTDIVGRIGGDEFILLLSGCREDDARMVVSKIRAAVSEEAAPLIGRELTLSMGALTVPASETESGKTQENLVRAADDLMYQVKKSGKNSALYASA